MKITNSNPTEVLTLEEAAAYLRLSPEVITQSAIEGNLPGQKIDNTWRFLKAAIDDWLRCRDSRTVLLRQAGALASDDTLEALQAAIDRDRSHNHLNSIDQTF